MVYTQLPRKYQLDAKKELLMSSLNSKLESILILLFYCFIALTSIRNLGVISALGFCSFVITCSLIKPRTGLLVLLSIFYLPTYQIELPTPFLIATFIIMLINFNKVFNRKGFKINSQLLFLYCIFLTLRFISILFVAKVDAFRSYFFISFSGLIHLFAISNLIEKKEDISYVLKMWGVIGAFAAILGYLHFLLQDTVYLRQIYISTADIDKSMIAGSLDYVRWIWAGSEPNFFGLQLLIPFAINVYFFMKEKSILNVLLCLISFAGILGTYSRSSFLVSIIIIFLYFILSGSLKNLLLYSFILLIGGFILIGYFSEFVERIDTISSALNDNNASGRFPLYLEAIKNFISNPLFGVGTGQTTYYSAFRLESHNLFLQTLGENGIFGFLTLISMFYYYIKKSILIKKDYSLFIITCIAVTLNSNTVSYFDMRVFLTLLVLINYVLYFERQNRMQNSINYSANIR